MNANELADELERPNNWQQENNFTTRAATMLRQQHAEIEALKNAKRFIQNFAEEQHHRACQLEEAQEADNEPVAWMYEKPNGASKLSFVKEKMLWEDMTETPLYTHPVKEQDESFDRTASHMAGEYVAYQKELTDAITLLEKYADKLEDERPNKGLSDVVLECVEILRKAQEK